MTELHSERVRCVVVDAANVSNRTSRPERRFRRFDFVRVREVIGEASRGCGGCCCPELFGFLV
jgi:hypothetical protein